MSRRSRLRLSINHHWQVLGQSTKACASDSANNSKWCIELKQQYIIIKIIDKLVYVLNSIVLFLDSDICDANYSLVACGFNVYIKLFMKSDSNSYAQDDRINSNAGKNIIEHTDPSTDVYIYDLDDLKIKPKDYQRI